MPQSERKSTLKVLHMGHYAIDKMNLRARETVLAWNYGRHQGHIPPVSNLCKICQESTKADTAVCRNTSSWMGTTWFRHILIERNTISSNS